MSGLAVAGSRWLPNVTRIYRTVKPQVAQNLALARSEMAPPSLGGLKADLMSVKLSSFSPSNILNMSFNEVAGRGLVLVELYLLFKVGEVLGRGHLVGYSFSEEERRAGIPVVEAAPAAAVSE